MDIYHHINPLNNIMSGLGQQQKTVSTNIANAHTPGYSRKSYSFTDVLGELANPFETKLSRSMGSMIENQFVMDDGRPVNLSEEMIEMQKVALNHGIVSRVLTGHFNVLKRAVQIGR